MAKDIYPKIPRLVKTDLVWRRGLKFVANAGSGNKFVLDAAKEHGGQNKGARPMEALLSALGGCVGMDLVTILTKQKRHLKSLKISVHGERAPSHPHVLQTASLSVEIKSDDITDEDVRWAMNLSLSKYCSVSAMLEKACKIDYNWQIRR